MTLRMPIELPQQDRNQCKSCVAAMVLYVFGKSQVPNPYAIDKHIGRAAGQLPDPDSTYYYLLAQGFYTHIISNFDDRVFVQQGLPYMKAYYRHQWNKSFDRVYTAKWADGRLARIKQVRRQYAHQITTHETWQVRTPCLEDIERMLAAGKVVEVCFAASRAELAHAVLIYQQRGNVFSVYYPTPHHQTLMSFTRDELASQWITGEGLTGFSIRR